MAASHSVGGIREYSKMYKAIEIKPFSKRKSKAAGGGLSAFNTEIIIKLYSEDCAVLRERRTQAGSGKKELGSEPPWAALKVDLGKMYPR